MEEGIWGVALGSQGDGGLGRTDGWVLKREGCLRAPSSETSSASSAGSGAPHALEGCLQGAVKAAVFGFVFFRAKGAAWCRSASRSVGSLPGPRTATGPSLSCMQPSRKPVHSFAHLGDPPLLCSSLPDLGGTPGAGGGP